MDKDRKQQKMKGFFLFLTGLFVICVFVIIAAACCDLACPECEGPDSACEECVYKPNCGSDCCKGGQSCCDNKKCYDPTSEHCCHYGTGKTCPNNKCCVNGECESSCSGGPYTAIFCDCGSGIGGLWRECSVKKEFHVCICGKNCIDDNKVVVATGSVYNATQIVTGRRCNGASYCSVTNVQGVDYVGSSTCFVVYSGCD